MDPLANLPSEPGVIAGARVYAVADALPLLVGVDVDLVWSTGDSQLCGNIRMVRTAARGVTVDRLRDRYGKRVRGSVTVEVLRCVRSACGVIRLTVDDVQKGDA